MIRKIFAHMQHTHSHWIGDRQNSADKVLIAFRRFESNHKTEIRISGSLNENRLNPWLFMLSDKTKTPTKTESFDQSKRKNKSFNLTKVLPIVGINLSEQQYQRHMECNIDKPKIENCWISRRVFNLWKTGNNFFSRKVFSRKL